jgi:hypothetical protein
MGCFGVNCSAHPESRGKCIALYNCHRCPRPVSCAPFWPQHEPPSDHLVGCRMRCSIFLTLHASSSPKTRRVLGTFSSWPTPPVRGARAGGKEGIVPIYHRTVRERQINLCRSASRRAITSISLCLSSQAAFQETPSCRLRASAAIFVFDWVTR